jgi:hypothetical protein
MKKRIYLATPPSTCTVAQEFSTKESTMLSFLSLNTDNKLEPIIAQRAMMLTL